MLRVASFLAFYAGWFACVGGAAKGWTLLGPGVAVLLVAIHLGVARERLREAALIAAVCAVGWAVETLHVVGGAIVFGPSALWVWSVPGWMVALWVIFATTLTTSLGYIPERDSFTRVFLFTPPTRLAPPQICAEMTKNRLPNVNLGGKGWGEVV